MVLKLKSKNNDLVPQIFLAVVSVILVGMIIYYVMISVKSTSRVANKLISQTEDTAIDIAEHEILKYDGEEISGAEVVNFIKKYLGDYTDTENAPIYVEVKKTGSTTIKRYTNKKYISDIKNFSNSEHYIKPTAKFIGEVVKNENKVILGIRFTQK